MQSAIFFRWNGLKPGREADGMRFADETDAMYARLEQEGKVAGHEWCANITGSDNHMFIARGEAQALSALASSQEFAGMVIKGRMLLDNFHWDLGRLGGEVDDVFPGWREAAGT